MIGPAQAADPSLAFPPRRKTEFFVTPVDKRPASAIGTWAAAGKMPKPNRAPGKIRRRGLWRCPYRRADRAGHSRTLRIFGGGGRRRPGSPVRRVADARKAETYGDRNQSGDCL